MTLFFILRLQMYYQKSNFCEPFLMLPYVPATLNCQSTHLDLVTFRNLNLCSKADLYDLLFDASS